MAHPRESALTYLECPVCRKIYPSDQIQTYCRTCNSPLFPVYDLPALRQGLDRDQIRSRPRGLWRWAELLPVKDPQYRLTLGEGDTPILSLPRLGADQGFSQLFVKDESLNPTGTFKARGMAVAISRAAELGIHAFVVPTAGNAGGALAAYAARAGAQAFVYMPEDAPALNKAEVKILGGRLHVVKGLISDAGKQAGHDSAISGWFDVSTFKEPYRVEGKKTIGFEVAEELGWQLPDVIVVPTGGGTGLVGMWKAFAELEALGWIGSQRSRMVCVQAEGCAPIVRAYHQGADWAEYWENAHTLAAGLRVPLPFADRLILQAIRESNGTAVAVTDAAIQQAQSKLAKQEGIYASPEGAAPLAAIIALKAAGWLEPDERILLLNTATGLKYA